MEFAGDLDIVRQERAPPTTAYISFERPHDVPLCVLLCAQDLWASKTLVGHCRKCCSIAGAVGATSMKGERLHGAELFVALGARGDRHVADELALRGRLLLGLRNLGSLRGVFWRAN
eukprot:2436783-Pyramimonas_sp.AAC.1